MFTILFLTAQEKHFLSVMETYNVILYKEVTRVKYTNKLHGQNLEFLGRKYLVSLKCGFGKG
jgi:hypothetical protein